MTEHYDPIVIYGGKSPRELDRIGVQKRAKLKPLMVRAGRWSKDAETDILTLPLSQLDYLLGYYGDPFSPDPRSAMAEASRPSPEDGFAVVSVPPSPVERRGFFRRSR